MKTMHSRRSFLGWITGAIALLVAPRPAKPLALMDKPKLKPEDIVTGYLDPEVRWGPGIEHPHWRVPQGRWTFVEDK